MSHTDTPGDSPGVVPVLRAYVEGSRRFDIDSLDEPAFKIALDAGVGSILAHVTSERRARSARHNEVHAADLTMQMMTGVILDTLADIIAAARRDGLEVTLLKGCAAALRYYHQPHHRTMGDVDLLVAEAQREPLERRLRELGFVQPGDPREALVRDHHHSLPFRHVTTGLWLEVHTRPYPPHSPLARRPGFSFEAVTERAETVAVGAKSARVMNHERQLVYTATRWAEMINAERGVFPLLDAALLLRARDGRLDWDDVCRIADDPWAAGALVLMLTYLNRCGLARIPRAILSRLATRDAMTNAVVRRLLHRLVTAYVMEGRPPGIVMTPSNRRIVWSTLVGARSPWRKLLALPVSVLFPPGYDGRFDTARFVRRVRSLTRKMLP